MFGRRKEDDPQTTPAADGKIDDSDLLPLKSKARAAQPTQPVTRPQVVRRAPDIHGATQRRTDGPAENSSIGKKLIVGRDITLTGGEIKDCDKLVVEGHVEATLTKCQEIEVAETGMFKGAADIDAAEISGVFEGELTARSLLVVRATGRITGSVRFGQLEVERGGEIIGDIAVCAQTGSQDSRPPRRIEPSPPEPEMPLRTAESPAE